MAMKSNEKKYGSVAVTIHWLVAVLILALLASGFQAANASGTRLEVALLRLHVPMGITIMLLTVFRAIWWFGFDKKPAAMPGDADWEKAAAKRVHLAFYFVTLVIGTSGIGMMLISGAGPILFGGASRQLPNFDHIIPHNAHVMGVYLMIALLVLHVGAALYHHFVKRDAIFKRMSYKG